MEDEDEEDEEDFEYDSDTKPKSDRKRRADTPPSSDDSVPMEILLQSSLVEELGSELFQESYSAGVGGAGYPSFASPGSPGFDNRYPRRSPRVSPPPVVPPGSGGLSSAMKNASHWSPIDLLTMNNAMSSTRGNGRLWWSAGF